MINTHPYRLVPSLPLPQSGFQISLQPFRIVIESSLPRAKS